MITRRSVTELWEHPYAEALCLPPLLFTHKLCYDLTGALLAGQDTNYGPHLVTPLDFLIPYIPIFILPYLATWFYGLFILFYAVYFGTYNKDLFRYFYLSFLVLTGLECLFWYNFPASIMIRVPSEILSTSGWLGSLTAYVYERATPWNVIPSAHIAFAFIALLLSKYFAPPRQRWLFLFLFIVIGLSVVFIKNHYLVDIAGGMVLSYLVYKLVFTPASKWKILERFSSPAVVGANYLVLAIVLLCYMMVLGVPWS